MEKIIPFLEWLALLMTTGTGFLWCLVRHTRQTEVVEMITAAKRFQPAALFTIITFTIIWPVIFVLANIRSYANR